MADTPIWVQLVTPIITAAATWVTTKFDLLSFRRFKQFEGIWHAYYIDPDSKELQEEIWEFSSLGIVSVSRNGNRTFNGRLSLKGNKAYMNVDSISKSERLFVMLDPPNNPRTGDAWPSICVWLGKDGGQVTTAGHGLLSREKIVNPPVKPEFLRAGVARAEG